MIEYIKLFLYLIIGFGIVNIIMILLGHEDAFAYVIGNCVIFLIVTLFTVDFSPRFKSVLNYLNAVVFVAFFVAFILKIYQIII
jgi:hypothetical protein